MFDINKNDLIVIRSRNHLKHQVERFRSVGKTEEEIIHWIESHFDKELNIAHYFDSVHELASFLNIPVSKFNIVWM